MMQEREAVAALRLLVAVVKADGKLLFEERRALEAFLDGAGLPPGVTVEKLLDEPVDVEAALREIESPEGRREVLASARAISAVDGETAKEEQEILDRIEAAFFDRASAAPDDTGALQKLLEEAKDTVLPSRVKRIDDAEKRAAEIGEDTLKYAIMSAVLGAFPVPGLAVITDVAVVALQTKLVRDVGLYFGHALDKEATRSLLGGIVGGAGLRIALSNVAKLVPGWGSLVGATSAFATTWGIGKVADRYFASGQKLSGEELGTAFRAAKKEGEGAYASSEARVSKKREESRAVLMKLHEDVKSGAMRREDYERKVAELV